MDKVILFYDTSCNLCHRSIAWFVKKDRKHIFYYAPLNGETAKKLLDEQYHSIDSVVLYESGKISLRSKAIFRAIRYLGGIWRLFGYLPSFFFDPLYRFIARYRKKIPIKKIPFPQERMLP